VPHVAKTSSQVGPQHIGRVGASDADAVATAYGKYGSDIRRYLLVRTRNVEIAEDLTQDVFLALLAVAPRLQITQGQIAPWLYAVARHRYVDHLRRSRRTDALFAPLETAEFAAAPEPNYDPELTDLLRQAVRSLSPAQRRICVMRLLEGRSYVEIGDELATSEPACRTQYSRAMTRLRVTLECAEPRR
jgi:RNA polymerase sigma factor (sigma-70 family)